MANSSVLPVPRVPVSVRLATLDDLAFIDGLQKRHSKELGYFPTKQFEGYIAMGGVLVAEHADEPRASASGPLPHGRGSLGYVVSRDRYLKRDELGVIFQLCVAPGEQRKLVGAELIRSVFERSAYGCKLYCCWCAQDIEANRFWESLGFVPVAFRAGSREKDRVHIFWQRRIREGDTTTPYWFPAQTSSGSIREERLVFPIPPGVHWSDPMPRVLPNEPRALASGPLPDGRGSLKPIQNPKSRIQNPPKPRSVYGIGRSKLRFVEPKPTKAAKEKRSREKPKAAKHDPKLIAAARELRDRWLEQINADPARILPAGKYDVARALEGPPAPSLKQLPDAA